MKTDCFPSPNDDEEQLWTAIHEYMKDRIGVTSILYGFTHSRYTAERIGISRSLYIKHSHPKDYVDHFGSDTFLNDDLCTTILLQQLEPFLWHHAANWPGATEAQKQRARIDDQFGMDVGVSIGFQFADGHGIAGIGLCAGCLTAEAFEQRWNEQADDVMNYLTMFEPLMRARMVANRMTLSERQRQVLAYSASGMQAKEIAAHLKIAEKTVHNYREDAREAIDADTTMEAVAKALAYRLI
jgi:LuxR family transcriptional regulator